jgi:hypothetical protein
MRVLRPHERVAYPADAVRPRTRGDCLPGGCNEVRPCPWVSCRYHLYLDVQVNGSILINYPDQEPGQVQHSCALDVAERGALTLDEVGKILRLSRERVRQICEERFLGLARSRALIIQFRELGEDVCNRISNYVTNFR